MIRKQIGNVSTESEVRHLDSGVVTIKVVSKLGSAVHKHTVTIGSVDGKDCLQNLSDEQLTTGLQQHLDKVRTEAAGILTTRARVSAITKNLS